MWRFERKQFVVVAAVALAALGVAWSVREMLFSSAGSTRSSDSRHEERTESFRNVDPAAPQIVQLASPELARRIGIETVPALIHKHAHHVEANAEAAYNNQRTAEVFARVVGVVREVRVDLNQAVKRGEVLAIIDSSAVGSAKAQYLTSIATVELAQATYERFRALTEKQIAAAKNELEALTALTQARATLTEAKQRLFNFGFSDREITQISKDNAADNLFELRAPLDGQVIAWDAIGGEAVEPTTQLFVLSDVSTLWLWIDVYEADIALLKIGQPIEFTISSADAPPFPGRITAIGTEVDRKTRTTRVRALLQNPNGRLRANQFGRATIRVADEHEAVVVPAEAVQHDGKTSIVFLVESAGRYRRQTVVARTTDDEKLIEIVTGVEPGQEVVTIGSFLLYSELVKDRIAEDVD